ncbi:hypothetical protein TNCV_637101 [Trichonephila clavipes]|nr:hypothetical protein TNCV_637101 [Trichonephila clavipes]
MEKNSFLLRAAKLSLLKLQDADRNRRRRIVVADSSAPVAVDQRAANFCRPLPVFWSSSVHCFQTRITVGLFRCLRVPIVLKENPPFLEGR